MSLLDKYASINASIEDTRRLTASTRSQLESTTLSIDNIREERASMLAETASATADLSRLELELKEALRDCDAKKGERARVEREHAVVKREINVVRRRMDGERLEFLERCREFRSECKRMRVQATILVLGGGGNFDVKGDSSEIDIWRRLQDEDLSLSDEEDEEDCEGIVSSHKRKKNKVDFELEQAIKDEKECRTALVGAECGLHAAKEDHSMAVQRCNERNQKLSQQRAQLQRHRKEVEELERKIGQVKDEIVEANQLGKEYERSEFVVCAAWFVIVQYLTRCTIAVHLYRVQLVSCVLHQQLQSYS